MYLRINFFQIFFQNKTQCFSWFYQYFIFFLGPLIKVVPGKRFTLPAESTLTRIYIRKTLSPLPVPKVDNSSNSKAKEATQTGKAVLYFPVKSPWYLEESLKQHIFSKRTDGKLLLLEISKSHNC